jgi:FeS assembly SUF system protein
MSTAPMTDPVPVPAETSLEQRVVAALKTCYDPEIPVDIHDLGLIYSVDISPDGFVTVKMTLTAPACPVAGSLPGEVETKVRAVEGVSGAKVELVWDPPWKPEMMSKLARLMLGM